VDLLIILTSHHTPSRNPKHPIYHPNFDLRLSVPETNLRHITSYHITSHPNPFHHPTSLTTHHLSTWYKLTSHPILSCPFFSFSISSFPFLPYSIVSYHIISYHIPSLAPTSDCVTSSNHITRAAISISITVPDTNSSIPPPDEVDLGASSALTPRTPSVSPVKILGGGKRKGQADFEIMVVVSKITFSVFSILYDAFITVSCDTTVVQSNVQ
jgi:hypothetical protein